MDRSGDHRGADAKVTKIYLCDPARNAACTKLLCFEHGGPCGLTEDVRSALLDLTGRPVEVVEEAGAMFKRDGKDT